MKLAGLAGQQLSHVLFCLKTRRLQKIETRVTSRCPVISEPFSDHLLKGYCYAFGCKPGHWRLDFIIALASPLPCPAGPSCSFTGNQSTLRPTWQRRGAYLLLPARASPWTAISAAVRDLHLLRKQRTH